MALKRLSLTRGDSTTWTVVFNQANGLPYDIRTWTIYFTVKENADLPDSAASLQHILIAGAASSSRFGNDGLAGSAAIILLPGDTVNLTPQEYDFDIQARISATEVYTVLKGKLDLEYDVSRASTAGT